MGRKPKSAVKSATRVQYGALPYRVSKIRGLEVLILTSRETRRWIVPKGWPIKGLKQAKTAAREAYEEAGVRGVVRNKPLGSYVYDKRMDEPGIFVPCEVKLFALRVTRRETDWPERLQREVRWVAPDEAVAAVGDEGLKLLIAAFAAAFRKRGKKRVAKRKNAPAKAPRR